VKVTPFVSLTDKLTGLGDSQKSMTFIHNAQESESLSFAELRSAALKLLAGFQAKGVSKGDEVVLYVENNKNFIIAFWACLFGAMIPVPVAVGVHSEHLQKLFTILSKLKRPFLFTEQSPLTRIETYAGETGQSFTLDRRVIDIGDALNDPASEHTDAGQADSLAFIQFSSGSTREPKGVMLSHANLVGNIEAMREGAAYLPHDKILSWMPLTHDMGLIGMHLAPLYCEMEHCLMPAMLFSRRPLLWLKKATEYRATILCSPNFGYKHYLKALGDKTIDDVDLSAVRLIYNGAEPISVDLCRQFLQRLAPQGLRATSMFLVYGLAEGTLAVSFPAIDTPLREVRVRRDSISVGDQVHIADGDDTVRFACVGHAVSSCEIRIALDGRAIGDERVGEVHIRGMGVTSGFYQSPALTEEIISADGWLNTGDLGFFHDGQLIITGRAKEIIFANGQNYYPQDLEAVIQQETAIELGRVVACGAHRDDTQMEELLIFVVHRSEVEALKPLAAKITKTLSSILGLEVHHVIPVRNIPKTTSGKLQRNHMASAYIHGEFDAVIAEINGSHPAQAPVGSANPLKDLLLGIIRDIAPGKTINPADDLFEAGLSSLQLAEMHDRIDAIYPGVVDFTDMFDFNTLNDVAQFIRTKVDA